MPLTNGEFGLLTALLQSPQRVLSREQLLTASRVHDNEVFDRSIDVQILRLRRKIEADASCARADQDRARRGIYASPRQSRSFEEGAMSDMATQLAKQAMVVS